MDEDYTPEEERAENGLDRRRFVKLGGAGLGLAFTGLSFPSEEAEAASHALRRMQTRSGPEDFFAADPMETVRIGFVGVGNRGTAHVKLLSQLEGTQINALCDIRPEHAERGKHIVMEAGHPAPTLYTRGETDFERLCAEENLDLVFTATPWRWHVPVCLAAMKNGKHAATEVPAAMTIEDCWALVETAEKEQKHCVMMENCNYDRPEMLVLSLVRRGLLGEILHGACGYLHDRRDSQFADAGSGLWRDDWAETHNCNLYPTHGLGPIANDLNINRGNRFDYLVSMASPQRGLDLWAAEHFRPGHPERAERYRLGDVNTSMIKTAQGQTVFLSLNTSNPRPYSRIHMVQGTHGLFHGYPDRIYIEGRSEPHQWEDSEAAGYYEDFEHPLWKSIGEEDQSISHGGMDYLENARLIYCLRNGLPTDMNVYDAATISAVVELTGRSNSNGSQPVVFPDFTRGKWKTWEWPEGSAFGPKAAQEAMANS